MSVTDEKFEARVIAVIEKREQASRDRRAEFLRVRVHDTVQILRPWYGGSDFGGRHPLPQGIVIEEDEDRVLVDCWSTSTYPSDFGWHNRADVRLYHRPDDATIAATKEHA